MSNIFLALLSWSIEPKSYFLLWTLTTFDGLRLGTYQIFRVDIKNWKKNKNKVKKFKLKSESGKKKKIMSGKWGN